MTGLLIVGVTCLMLAIVLLAIIHGQTPTGTLPRQRRVPVAISPLSLKCKVYRRNSQR